MKGAILVKGAGIMIDGIEKVGEMLNKYQYIQSSGLDFRTTVANLVKMNKLIATIEGEFGNIDSFVFEMKKRQMRD